MVCAGSCAIWKAKATTALIARTAGMRCLYLDYNVSVVEVVIPVTPSRGMFLISLTKRGQRKFLTVSEEDILDLPEDADILKKVTSEVQSTLAAI